MNKLLSTILVTVVLLSSFGVALATGTAKVNICHATESEENPYEALRVADDGNWNGHMDHDGDFLYAGPTDDGKPTKDGDEWCEENTPEEEPVDVCPNLEGVQESLPENYHFETVVENDKEVRNCVVDETPPPPPPTTPTPPSPPANQVTELVAAGAGYWNWLLPLIVAGIVALGYYVWISRKK